MYREFYLKETNPYLNKEAIIAYSVIFKVLELKRFLISITNFDKSNIKLY